MAASGDIAAATRIGVGRSGFPFRLAVGLVTWVARDAVPLHGAIADILGLRAGFGHGSGESGGDAGDKEDSDGEAHC